MIKRDVYLDRLISYKDNDLIKVITGIRRSGKSVLLFELFYEYLLSVGVNKDKIIKVDLESYSQRHLRNADELYSHISSLIKDGHYYILIDEIQTVDDFEDVLTGMKVDFDCDIYVSGSNSKLLSKEIHTKMRGRSFEIKMYPLSFKEYYDHLGGDKIKAFNNYLAFGGLPYLADKKAETERVDYLDMVLSTVVSRDIQERHDIRNISMFNAILEILASNIGSYVNANKISNALKSSGFKTASAEMVGNYLDYFCESYLFYKAQRYDIKGKSYLKTLNKYYVADLGIRNAILNFRQQEITHSIENIVYLELIKRGYIVDIGKNNEKEIDFIAKNEDDQYYIQVAYTLHDEDKWRQEMSSFKGIDDGYRKVIITMDDVLFKTTTEGYKMINLIDFLLNLNSLKEL